MWKELGEQQKQSKLAGRPQYVKNGDHASAGENGFGERRAGAAIGRALKVAGEAG
ncbi:hypothetical protein HMPREF9238_01391 [Gleimia europaea ACS-120-V-Col10b]|uniref:Uncharacterized protein n=1 Tax=Gleimia europaea ACS-120-V-Col10b TaxID=883069 RepID=A0A9W5RFT9_9ACTO|nr:hypothetical protein HMPREF9238_01391 [Gleimia europaea ACS-120-V-Col10b]